jgi:hypothetical protein
MPAVAAVVHLDLLLVDEELTKIAEEECPAASSFVEVLLTDERELVLAPQALKDVIRQRKTGLCLREGVPRPEPGFARAQARWCQGCPREGRACRSAGCSDACFPPPKVADFRRKVSAKR